MPEFNFTSYTNFIIDYSSKNGQLIDEHVLNLSPQRLKKELNNVYNTINILNGNDLLKWNPVENYLVGELCQNKGVDDKYYRAKRNNTGKRPDLFTNIWEIAKSSDYTSIGDFSNYLSKNNIQPYTPKSEYNPATKGYVDFGYTKKLDKGATAINSAALNGEVVTNTLSTSSTKPASVGLVYFLNEKVDTKLNSSEFTPNNILDMIKTVDGSGSNLNADLLDGIDSTGFMKVNSISNFNTEITPGSYLANKGAIGAPSSTEIYTLIVIGESQYKSQIASSIESDKIFFRNYNTSWSSWKEFANKDGNVLSAAKLTTARTITLDLFLLKIKMLN